MFAVNIEKWTLLECPRNDAQRLLRTKCPEEARHALHTSQALPLYRKKGSTMTVFTSSKLQEKCLYLAAIVQVDDTNFNPTP